MIPAAAWSEDHPRGPRMLVVARATVGAWIESERAAALPRFLDAGDVVVLNDAATLPASLAGLHDERPVETRLARFLGADAHATRWSALLFGAGDFRTRTEDRAPPPRVRAGDELRFARDFVAKITRVHEDWRGRLVDLTFPGSPDAFARAVYRVGKPIQYAHTARAFAPWDVQNVFAARPWSVEPASAGRAIRARELSALRARGVHVVTLTHAAGLSSTGDDALDARLPFPERSDIPLRTVDAVREAKRAGKRVVAVGTTVVRALEGRAACGALEPGESETDHLVTRETPLRVVTSLVTGLHEEGSSHFRLLEAFVDRATLARALGVAARVGYRSHELGDTMLIL